MLQLTSIQKTFGDFSALRDLSFSVPTGSIFGLLGPNGAGKTTAIRIINAIYQADAGTVTWNKTQITEEWVRKHVGYLPEERGLYPQMSVQENLYFFAQIHRQELTAELKERIQSLLVRFDLSDHAKKPLSKLSKGMQQKVQIIATILHNPELLILDEPFTGLDPVNTRKLKELIRELQAEGKTIILSTHRMEQVEELCTNIVLVHRGGAVLQGPVQEVKAGNRTNTYRIQTEQPIQAPVPGTSLSTTENSVTFQVPQAQDAQQFLSEILTSHTVLEFREIFPSLEEIFITQVNTPDHD